MDINKLPVKTEESNPNIEQQLIHTACYNEDNVEKIQIKCEVFDHGIKREDEEFIDIMGTDITNTMDELIIFGSNIKTEGDIIFDQQIDYQSFRQPKLKSLEAFEHNVKIKEEESDVIENVKETQSSIQQQIIHTSIECFNEDNLQLKFEAFEHDVKLKQESNIIGNSSEQTCVTNEDGEKINFVDNIQIEDDCIVDQKTNSRLKQLNHNLIHTGIKPYKCDECGMCFTRAGNLKQHKLIHAGIKSYKCDECDKYFARTGNLKQHKLIHAGIKVKPYKCDECDKCFGQTGTLKQHKLIHAGIKSYTCNECDKCFTRAGNLKQHKLIHAGVKPYKCHECDKCFIQAWGLKQHKVMHTGIKEYQCD